MSQYHVLRLCSVFEPAVTDLGPGSARFDPVGGMQNHTAALTRCLDALGWGQTVVTSRLAGAAGASTLGDHAVVRRVGIPTTRFRQLWGLCALPFVLRRRRRVDVVHAHQGEDVATLLLAQLAAWWHRCPLVVTLHTSVSHTFTGRSLRALVLRRVGGAVEEAALGRASVVVAIAQRTADLVRRDGELARRVHVIPSGFEPALFAEALPATRPSDRRAASLPRVGYVGRLAEQKRPDHLVEAFALMREPAELVIVGDGPLRERVEALARDSSASARISLRGFVHHTEVPGVLASLDVLALPSAYEELGSVLVEAMALGVPAVATRVGGIPELVVDGETGLLVPPGDLPALAQALDRLVADPVLAERLGACARERSAAYSWPGLARRVAALYESVLPPRLLGAVSAEPVGAADERVPDTVAGEAPRVHLHPGGGGDEVPGPRPVGLDGADDGRGDGLRAGGGG